MKLVLALLVALLAIVSAKNPAFRWGHAAYTYGPMHCTEYVCDVVPSCNKAKWSKNIKEYNEVAPEGSKISVIYSYGGDIEFWPNPHNPTACHKPASEDPHECAVSVFFDDNNKAAASKYAETEGVETVIALLDSRMDGWPVISKYNDYDACKFGNFYPDLRNLTDTSLQNLAENAAKLYCSHSEIAGVQVDLEPYVEPYRQALGNFMGRFAKAMIDEHEEFGCRTEKYPAGRTVSYFTFAHNHKPSFNAVLNENGYYVFSGYDLWPKNEEFEYNTVEEFGEKLRKEIPYMRQIVGYDKKFTVALPIAASCHEYEEYVPMDGAGCGPACGGWTNLAKMRDYVNKWFEVMLDEGMTQSTDGLFCMDEENDSQFLGISLWVWTDDMTYPPEKWFDNTFMPPNPSGDVLDILKDNLYKFSDGTTCLSR
eukprot:TRINITY_DN10657_c0_g1_i1.p1 TRINITY_DN10657_c0_g1~~TRINITY_DN10657_c0_g1_i1.p1  ORF type:complete len:425 (-),score=105.22 TRINITY_DN10657_c0_g1_i1:344-1618(-)